MSSPDVGKRNTSSCDYCRKQKVKCTRLENGSCQRCLHVGRHCISSNIRLGRPYYQRSKEYYDLMSAVVQRFLPGIALNKESLRGVLAQIQGSENTPEDKEQAAGFSIDTRNDTLTDDVPGVTTGRPIQEDPLQASIDSNFQLPPTSASLTGQTALLQNTASSSASDTAPESTTAVVSTSISGLEGHVHSNPPILSQPRPIGTAENAILFSSQGSRTGETFPVEETVARRETPDITRYDSGTSWIAFFTKIRAASGSRSGGLFRNPPAVISEVSRPGQPELVDPAGLPPRVDFEKASLRFFAEINCVNFIISYGKFHSFTINAFDHKRPVSHAVFMLFCLIVSFDERYEEYFAKACEHFDSALEEASIESVEALMLMALCRFNKDQRSIAWISLGCAGRIAQSLGLHLNESYWDEDSPMVIENRKRLWWSLYDLEICFAYRLGRTPGLDEAACGVSMPSEMMFSMTPNTPPEYYRVLFQLSRLNGIIVRELYGPGSASTCLDNRADEFLNDLARFWENFPSHLKPDAAMASAHTRAILSLGLRYEYSILLATRPSIVFCWRNPGIGSTILTTRVEMAEAANKRSLLIIKRMAEGNLLSRLNFLDASYILANMVMLILRMVKDPSPQLLKEAEEYRHVFDFTQHLDIGRTTKRNFDDTVEEVWSLLQLQGQFQSFEHAAVGELLQGFVAADDSIWPSWFPDPAANSSWAPTTP